MELDQAVRTLVEQEIRARRVTLRSMAPRTGRSYSWLWNRIVGRTQLTLQDVTIIAHAFDTDARDFIARASELADNDPEPEVIETHFEEIGEDHTSAPGQS